jgi:hypothetical protein
MSSSPQDLTLSNVPQTLTLGNVPQNLTLSNVPQTLTLNNVPQQPQGGLSAVAPQMMPTAEQLAQNAKTLQQPNITGSTWMPEAGAYMYHTTDRWEPNTPTPETVVTAQRMPQYEMPTPMPTPMPQPEIVVTGQRMPQYEMPVMPTPMPQYEMPVTPTPMPVTPPEQYMPTPMPTPMPVMPPEQYRPVPRDNSITNWDPAYTPAKKPNIADMLMRAGLGSAVPAPQSQNLTLSNVPQTLTLGNVPQQQGGSLGSLINKYY